MPGITVTERIEATSETTPHEAIEEALAMVRATVDEITHVDVKHVEVILKSGDVVGYRVVLKVDHLGGERAARLQQDYYARVRSPRLPRPNVRGLLRTDEDDVERIGRSRVPLDAVVHSFVGGKTAEEIQKEYPSLTLADIFGVFSYYLQRREAVDRYIEAREREAQEWRAKIEDTFELEGLRERLLARRADG